MIKAGRPPREIVERIIRDEAARACVDLDDVIHLKRDGAEAARLAMRRIVRETHCTPGALADVWGCTTSAAYSFLGGTRTGKPEPKAWPQAPGIGPATACPPLDSILTCFSAIDRIRSRA